jgi:hypothetical protein
MSIRFYRPLSKDAIRRWLRSLHLLNEDVKESSSTIVVSSTYAEGFVLVEVGDATN